MAAFIATSRALRATALSINRQRCINTGIVATHSIGSRFSRSFSTAGQTATEQSSSSEPKTTGKTSVSARRIWEPLKGPTAADMLDELKKLHAIGLRYPMSKMIKCMASTVQTEEDFESLKEAIKMYRQWRLSVVLEESRCLFTHNDDDPEEVQRLHAKMGAELLAHPERYRVFVSPRVLVTVLKPMLDFGYHKEAVVAIQSNTSSLIALPALMLQVLRAGDHPECFEPIMNIYYKSRTNLFEVEHYEAFLATAEKYGTPDDIAMIKGDLEARRAFPEYANLTNKHMMWALRIGALKMAYLHLGDIKKVGATRKPTHCEIDIEKVRQAIEAKGHKELLQTFDKRVEWLLNQGYTFSPSGH